MASLNKVILIGRLGHQPELQHSQSGTVFCKLNVATDELYINKSGERTCQTEWHHVVTFNQLAEFCSQVLTKGSLIYVEGSLSTHKWQDKTGNTQYSTKINAFKINFINKKSEPSQNNNFDTNINFDKKNIKDNLENNSGNLSFMDDAPFF